MTYTAVRVALFDGSLEKIVRKCGFEDLKYSKKHETYFGLKYEPLTLLLLFKGKISMDKKFPSTYNVILSATCDETYEAGKTMDALVRKVRIGFRKNEYVEENFQVFNELFKKVSDVLENKDLVYS